jgi:hypothetical protein
LRRPRGCVVAGDLFGGFDGLINPNAPKNSVNSNNSTSNYFLKALKPTKVILFNVREFLAQIHALQIDKEILKFFSKISCLRQEKSEFKAKLFKLGSIRTLKFNSQILEEGNPIEYIFFIIEGTVTVTKSYILTNTTNPKNDSPHFRKKPESKKIHIANILEGDMISLESQSSAYEFNFTCNSSGVTLFQVSIKKLEKEKLMDAIFSKIKDLSTKRHKTWFSKYTESVKILEREYNIDHCKCTDPDMLAKGLTVKNIIEAKNCFTVPKNRGRAYTAKECEGQKRIFREEVKGDKDFMKKKSVERIMNDNFQVDNRLGSTYKKPWYYREKINLDRLVKDVEVVNRQKFEKQKLREQKVIFGKIVKSLEVESRAGSGLENKLHQLLAAENSEVQANQSILGEFEKLESEKKMLSLSKSKKKKPVRSSIEKNSTPRLKRSLSKPSDSQAEPKPIQIDSDIQSDLLLQLYAQPAPERSLFDLWLANGNPTKHLRMNSCNPTTQPLPRLTTPQQRSLLLSADKNPKSCELSSTGLGLTESNKYGFVGNHGASYFFANSEFRKKKFGKEDCTGKGVLMKKLGQDKSRNLSCVVVSKSKLGKMRNDVSFDQEIFDGFLGNDSLPKLRSNEVGLGKKDWQFCAEDLSGFMGMSEGLGSTIDVSLARKEFSLQLPEFKSEFLEKVSHLRHEKYLLDATLKPAYQSVFMTHKGGQEFAMKANIPDASL